MSETSPRRRKSAASPVRSTVKASLTVGVDLHARWAAAAALRGLDRNAFAVEALTEAVRGIVIIDRRKSPGRLDPASGEGSADPE